MKLQTQRAIDRWLGQFLCALVSAWVGLTQRSAATLPAQPRHIVVILLSEMGSIVLAGPMFAQLRRRFPSAHIHVLQLKKNQEVARLLALTEQSRLHTLDDSSGLRLLRDILLFSWRMRRLGVDAVVDCELFSRVSSLLSFACGAPVRVGFTPHTQEGLYRGSFIHHSIPYNPYQHISKQFLSLVDALTDAGAPRNKPAPIRSTPLEPELAVDFSPTELDSYRAQLHKDHTATVERRLVLLYAGGGLLPERAWPV